MSTVAQQLEPLLAVPVAAADPAAVAQIESGPLPAREAIPLADVERLADPAELPHETGWTNFDDGVGYVAVRTAMPDVSAAMVDWWFDWHPREAVRYRVWLPIAHSENRLDAPGPGRAKAHWGAVHHPVEDIGTGSERLRIAFAPPSELGMADDHLEDPAIGTIVCGLAGDDARGMAHTVMFHVFLRAEPGLVLRSHFWIGAAIGPFGRGRALGRALLNRPAVRRRLLPRGVPRALALHCAEEYRRLGELLPELYERFGNAG